MKVDKDNLKHWLILIISAIFIFASMPFRLFKSKKTKSIVFFYQMHGNVQPLMEYIQSHDKKTKMYFLAFPEYLKIYEGKQPLPTLSMLNFWDMIKVAQCDVLVTNYGALTLIYYAKFTSIKFVDVFHGILLLKFMPPPILTYLNNYDEVWISSPKMKKIYTEKFGVTAKLVPTGYGRVDKLVNRSYRDVKKKYAIPNNKKVIMIAPTWKHNDPDRSLLPFGMDQKALVGYLKKLAKETNSYIIFRAHMLSGSPVSAKSASDVRAMPSNEYPDTEELLSIVDILVTDWSSLSYDFMVLDRPVIFIDTRPPFRDEELALRANPGGRFGEIVKLQPEFDAAVKKYLKSPDQYLKKHAKKIAAIKAAAYGPTADGKATERYYKQLKALMNKR